MNDAFRAYHRAADALVPVQIVIGGHVKVPASNAHRSRVRGSNGGKPSRPQGRLALGLGSVIKRLAPAVANDVAFGDEDRKVRPQRGILDRAGESVLDLGRLKLAVLLITLAWRLSTSSEPAPSG